MKHLRFKSLIIIRISTLFVFLLNPDAYCQTLNSKKSKDFSVKNCDLYLKKINAETSCKEVINSPRKDNILYDDIYKRWKKICDSCFVLKKSQSSKEDLHEWIYKDHISSFCKVANETDSIITVRKTGKFSIQRIKEGFASKGHDILEKSIKPKSLSSLAKTSQIKLKNLSQFYPEKWLENKTLSGQSLITYLEEENFNGYIGWWLELEDGSKTPVGIYTVSSGCKKLFKNEKEQVVHGGCRVTFKDAINHKITDAYTGDYDLHDMILTGENINLGFKVPSVLSKKNNKRAFPANTQIFSGSICDENNPNLSRFPYCIATPVPKKDDKSHYHNDFGDYSKDCNEHPAELRISCLLNQNIKREDICKTSSISPSHCKLLRHGAQSNYFQFQQETKEILIPSLVVVDKDLAVIEPLDSILQVKNKNLCNYYILGKNKESNYLEEYLALYKLARLGFDNLTNNEGPLDLAVQKSREKKTPPIILKIQKESIIAQTKNITEELDSSIKKPETEERLDIKNDCIENIYKVEQLKKIFTQFDYMKKESLEKNLDEYKQFLCNSEKKKSCPQQIKEDSGQEALDIWLTMATTICQ